MLGILLLLQTRCSAEPVPTPIASPCAPDARPIVELSTVTTASLEVCPWGGTARRSGHDKDHDGGLSEIEVEAQSFDCNPPPTAVPEGDVPFGAGTLTLSAALDRVTGELALSGVCQSLDPRESDTICLWTIGEKVESARLTLPQGSDPGDTHIVVSPSPHEYHVAWLDHRIALAPTLRVTRIQPGTGTILGTPIGMASLFKPEYVVPCYSFEIYHDWRVGETFVLASCHSWEMASTWRLAILGKDGLQRGPVIEWQDSAAPEGSVTGLGWDDTAKGYFYGRGDIAGGSSVVHLSADLRSRVARPFFPRGVEAQHLVTYVVGRAGAVVVGTEKAWDSFEPFGLFAYTYLEAAEGYARRLPLADWSGAEPGTLYGWGGVYDSSTQELRVVWNEAMMTEDWVHRVRSRGIRFADRSDVSDGPYELIPWHDAKPRWGALIRTGLPGVDFYALGTVAGGLGRFLRWPTRESHAQR